MYEDPQAAKANIGAGALVFHENKILLVQVNYGEFRESWILPGGMVQPGEHPHEAAQRETREETGLEINIVSQIAVRPRIYENKTANLYFVFLGQLRDLNQNFNTLKYPHDELLAAQF